MRMCDNIDITKKMLPSFEPFGDLVERIAPDGREQVELVAKMFRRGYMRYRLITFEKK